MEVSVSKGRDKSRLATLAVAISGGVLVAALLKFNHIAQGYEYYLVGNLMALFFAPMMVIFFLLGEDLSEYGFSLGNWRRVRWWVLILFAALMVLLIPASRRPEFQNYYPIFKQFYPFHDGQFQADKTGFGSISSLWPLLYGWASYGMYLFCWEFFFRGYLLFGLARTIRWWAIFPQAIAFGILHINKPVPEVIASFAAGIILGVFALRAKSFLPCFVLHWMASVAFDVLVLVSR